MKKIVCLLVTLTLLLALTPVTSFAETVISSVQVEITRPFANATPDSYATCWGTSYQLYQEETPISWRDDTASRTLVSGDRFIKGHQYTVRILLEAKDGYQFSYANPTYNTTGRVNYQSATVSKSGIYEIDNTKVLALSYTFTDCKNPVSYILLGIDTPKPGQYFRSSANIVLDPDSYYGLLSNVHYRVNTSQSTNNFIDGIRWYDITSGSYMTSSSRYQRGHRYRVSIALQPYTLSDYGFQTHPDGRFNGTVMINGTTAECENPAPLETGQLIASYTFPEVCTQDIVAAEASGFEMPVGGENPDYTGSVVGSAYKISSYTNTSGTGSTTLRGYVGGVRWFDNTTGSLLKASDVFTAGHIYTVRVLLEANPDFTFVIDADTNKYILDNHTINGEDAVVRQSGVDVPDGNRLKYLAIEYEFPAAQTQEVDGFDILGVTPPTPGALPSYTGLSVPAGSRYSIMTTHTIAENNVYSGVRWSRSEGGSETVMKSSDRFEGDTYYTARVWVSMTDGNYVFSDAPSATINGEPGKDITVDSSKHTWARASYTFFCANEVTETAEVEIAGPEGSKKPSFEAVAVNNPNVEVLDLNEGNFVHGVAWYDNTEGFWLTEDSLFVKGHEYSVSVITVPKIGYRFAIGGEGQPEVQGYVNGMSANVFGDAPAVQLTLSYSFPSCGGILIEIVDVGVTAPKAGCMPAFSPILPEDAHFAAITGNMNFPGGVRWFDYTDSRVLAAEDVFVEGHDYEVTLYLGTEEGYDFATDIMGSPAVSASVNGDAALSDSYSAFDPRERILVRYMFLDIGYDMIWSAAVDIDEPVNGEQASFEPVESGTGFHAWSDLEDLDYSAGVSWIDKSTNTVMQPGDCFIGGHTYLLSVQLKPDPGYAFDPGIYCSLNGDTSVTYMIAGGNLFIGSEYPCPADIIDVVSLTDVKDITKGMKAGDDILENCLAGAPERYLVKEKLSWKDAQTGVVMGEEDTFEAGSTYTLRIVLQAQEGFLFADPGLITASVNGSAAVPEEYGDMEPGTGLVVCADMICRTVVTNAAVTGIAAPVPGGAPSYTAAAGSSFYTAGDVHWYDEKMDELDPSDIFLYDVPYTVTVELSAKSYAMFEAGYDSVLERYLPTEAVSGSINGKDAEIDPFAVEDVRAHLLLRYTFGPCGRTLIDSVSVTDIAEPVIGKPADFSAFVDEEAPYSIVSVSWIDEEKGTLLNADDRFAADKTYDVHIVLCAKEGYAFPCVYDELNGRYVYQQGVNGIINGIDDQTVGLSLNPELDGRRYLGVTAFFYSGSAEDPHVYCSRMQHTASDYIDVAVRKDSGEIITDGAASPSAPLLAVSFNENGRFITVTFVTEQSAAIEAAEDAAELQLIWVDASDAPKCQSETVIMEP